MEEQQRDPLWIEENNFFGAQLKANPHLKHLQGRMFIDQLHQEVKVWHILVDSICLDTKGKTRLLLNAMHDINKYVHFSSSLIPH
jgi:hypothetical protein